MTKQNDGMQVGGGGFDLLSRLGHGDDLHKQARAEIERLREVLTIPLITPDTTTSAFFIRVLSEHEKGLPVNAQDLINALMWRVKNQKRELARLHERSAEQDRAIEQLHAAVRTAQELAARRLMEIERLRKDLRECRGHLTDVIASQDRPAIKAAADWLSDWEGTRIDPGSAPEPIPCGWQPIETAPIDGTPILAWVKGCNKHHDYGDTLVVRADQTMNKIYLDRGGERFWGFPGVGGLRASHWMPLPEPPAQGASRDASSEPCEHLRSEFLAQKLSAQPPFEMRKCLDCTKIFRKRLTLKSGEGQ